MTGASQFENSFDRSKFAEFANQSGVFTSTIPPRVLQLAARPASTRAVGMDQVTLDRLDRTIGRAMTKGRTLGVGEVGRAIKKDFADMSRHRSRLIATTEMNFSMSRGTFSRAVSLGSKLHSWISVGDRFVDTLDCLPNEINSSSGIPIAKPFTSGHMTTPAHPRCRCTVAYFGADPVKVEERFTPASRAAWIVGLAATIFVRPSTVEGKKEGDPGHVSEPLLVSNSLN